LCFEITVMGDEYYYSQAGQRCGPVPGEQLKQLAASGQLQPTDLIWKEGMPGWIAAAKVKGLFPAPPEPNRVADHTAPAGPASRQQDASSAERPSAADAARVQARQAKDAAIAAGGHALAAFKVLIRNPVGGLRDAFDLLGPAQALGAGIIFAVVFVVCGLLAEVIGAGRIPAVSVLLKDLLFCVLAFATTVGVCFASQAMFRGHGGIQADVFIAGASLLPPGAALLLLSIIASRSVMVDLAIFILAGTTTTLMIYSGCSTVLRVPETVATIAVPAIFIIDALLLKLLLGGMLTPAIAA
jgi:hypothetical protein